MGLLLLMVLLLISVYTNVLYQNFSRNMLEAVLTRDTTCADAIHRLVSDELTREDFDDPAVWNDMTSPRYLELQKDPQSAADPELHPVSLHRQAGGGRAACLPHRRSGSGGGGLCLPRHPHRGGDGPPYIQTALSGEAVYSRDVVDTTWGPIFTACYPVKDENGQVMGALCVEIGMDTTYQF